MLRNEQYDDSMIFDRDRSITQDYRCFAQVAPRAIRHTSVKNESLRYNQAGSRTVQLSQLKIKPNVVLIAKDPQSGQRQKLPIFAKISEDTTLQVARRFNIRTLTDFQQKDIRIRHHPPAQANQLRQSRQVARQLPNPKPHEYLTLANNLRSITSQLGQLKCLLDNLLGNQHSHIRQNSIQYWKFNENSGDIATILFKMIPANMHLALDQLFIIEKFILMSIHQRLHEGWFKDLFQLLYESIHQFVAFAATHQMERYPNLVNDVEQLLHFQSRSQEQLQVSILHSVQQLVVKISDYQLTLGQGLNSLERWLKNLDLGTSNYAQQISSLRGAFSLWMYENDDALIHHMPQTMRSPPAPYFASLSVHQPILVVDLDETLVHYQRYPDQKNQLYVRSFAREFLETLAKSFQIIIWTASLPRYARWAIHKIGAQVDLKLLTRQHCILSNNNQFVKELSRIQEGCIDRTILVENEIKSSAEDERENCILVESFIGPRDDHESIDQSLYVLTEQLQFIAQRWMDGCSMVQLLKQIGR